MSIQKTPDTFLYLCASSFFFIASFAVNLSQMLSLQKLSEAKDQTLATIPQVKAATNYKMLPLLKDTGEFPILTAQGVVAFDLNTQTLLYEKNADLQLLPASTTKVMTALVALEYFPLDTVLQIPPITVVGQKMKLFPGEKITVRSLLDGLLIYSANDAAEVLAAHYPGGREGFVAAMNEKSKNLALTHTHFENPSGLDDSNHFSTARDMVFLTKNAIQNPILAEIVNTKDKTVTSIDGKFVHQLANINELLGTVDGVVGVKTGWTENARENLITYIKRNNQNVIIAVLGSQDRFGETKQLINWIFNKYEWVLTYSP